MQIAITLSRAIRDGVYQPGDRLPSQEQIAEQFNVARMTARNGMRLLEDFGFVTVVRGSGAYVTNGSPPPQPVSRPAAPRDYDAELDELRERVHKLEQADA